MSKLHYDKCLVQHPMIVEQKFDTPMYSKLERSECDAKREHVIKLADLLKTSRDELLTLWLVGQVYKLVKDEENAMTVLKNSRPTFKMKQV